MALVPAITKVCSSCKGEKPTASFSQDRSRLDGVQRHCKPCHKLLISEWRNKNPDKVRESTKKYYISTHKEYLSGWTRTITGKFSEGKSAAKQRGISWNLSKDQYIELVSNPCSYCGDSVIDSSGYSLDRVDSTKPYNIENVVPCCFLCNRMKNISSVLDFELHIQKICNKRGLKDGTRS